MSQTLTLELNDEIYAAIRRQAEAAGTSPAQVVAASLAQQFGLLRSAGGVRVLLTEAEKQAARERFERHFGEVDLGRSTGADNESIEADLAREYDDTHGAR